MSSPHAISSAPPVQRALAGPVVVGFDGSAEAHDALVLGRQLADLTDGKLTVGIVTPLDLYVTPDPVLAAELDASQFEQADELVEQAAATLGGEEGPDWQRWVVAARSTAVGLQRIAERLEAGIVVLGRTRRHGVARVMPGTTASRLLHGAPCPVAIAPEGWASRADGLRRITAGVDGSPESLIALELAATLASREGTTVEAVSVYERPNPADPAFAFTAKGYTAALDDLRTTVEHRLRRALEPLRGDAATPVVLEGKPSEVLASHGAGRDLLVIGSRGYGPMHAVMAGEVALALSTRAACALLVTPRGLARTG